MKSSYQQQGIGMVEVMVSLLLLALGVLGFSAMQVRSLQSTAKSSAYTEAVSIMRDLSERIRANPAALERYESSLNSSSFSEPSASCGAFKSSNGTTLCDKNEVADADVYSIKQRYKTENKNVSRLDLEMSIISCPGSHQTGDNQTKCIVAAWNDTKPTLGSDSDVDCLNDSNGKYHPKSDCLIMEVM